MTLNAELFQYRPGRESLGRSRGGSYRAALSNPLSNMVRMPGPSGHYPTDLPPPGPWSAAAM